MSSAEAAIELAVGPLFVFICIAFILFGVFTSQVYYYFFSYDKDTIKLKSFVAGMWVLEAVHTAFCMHFIYFWFVQKYGDPVGGINFIVWSVPSTIVLEAIIEAAVELFYIRRIWHLCGKKTWVVALPILLVFARAGLSLGSVTYLYKLDTWDLYRASGIAQVIVEAGYALSAALDIVITGLLIFLLRTKRTKFARTNRRLQKLMHYTINTGAITVVVALAIIGTLKISNSLLFGGFVEIISKLYANSMLAMLNARKHIRYGGDTEDDYNTYEFETTGHRSGHGRADTRVRIITETNVSKDIDRNPRLDHSDEALASYKSFDGKSYGKASADALAIAAV